MKIDLRNRQRERLFRIAVDPKDPPSVVRAEDGGAGGAGSGGGASTGGAGEARASGSASAEDTGATGKEVFLDWDGAFDDHHHLRRCPVCGCRELFARRDFPQVTGFAIVVAAAVAATILFGANEVIGGVIVLAVVVLIDAIIYLFAGRCLVCYRCRSEFRDTPIREDHAGWELATGEKYRAGDHTEPSAETK